MLFKELLLDYTINQLIFPQSTLLTSIIHSDFFLNYSIYIYLFLCFFVIFIGLSSIFIENPIFSVICLIFVFILASFLFFYFNFKFIGLLIIIIYVGAISVLFLYGVMLYRVRQFDVFRQSYFPTIFTNYCKKFVKSVFNSLKNKLISKSLNINFMLLLTFFSIIFFFSFLDPFFFFPLFGLNVSFLQIRANDFYALDELQFLGTFLFNNFYIYVVITSFLLLIAMCSVILFNRINPKDFKIISSLLDSFYFYLPVIKKEYKLMKIRLKNGQPKTELPLEDNILLY